jgi:hypothetical protein
MAVLVWNQTGEKLYETGVKKGVLYPLSSDNKYTPGVAWNGLTSVSLSPEGADVEAIYADDVKYMNLISTEELNGTIEAYMSPEEFDACDGAADLATGVSIGQQSRKTFGLCFRTTVANDVTGVDYGYKLHLVYGCLASPSERSFETINDSPEAMTLSWEFSTTPVNVAGHKPTALVTIDSTKVDATKLKALEDILYGTDSEEARLPLPDEIATLFAAG